MATPPRPSRIRPRSAVCSATTSPASCPARRRPPRLKDVLIEQGAWSQYLEVGIGPDAEIFTKAPVLAAVGTGADVGIHPGSVWNNPEPEVVLAVEQPRARRSAPRSATTSTCATSKAAARCCSARPRTTTRPARSGPSSACSTSTSASTTCAASRSRCAWTGRRASRWKGSSSLSKISRDPLDLVSQAIGPHHAYPDGLMLFLGTMFAPTQDRHGPGQGFTHVVGDRVTISAPELGALDNRVGACGPGARAGRSASGR